MKLRVLVACEYSGSVRDAFRALGHDAMSCDLLPTDVPGPHHQGDVFEVMNEGFDLMVAHPPCTHLAVSGARWFKHKQNEQKEALEFVQRLMDAPIRHIAIENPVSIISSRIRRPEQIIQPWMFGDPFQKTTCLWLKNLPGLEPTKIVDKGEFFEWTDKKTGKKKRQAVWYKEAWSKGDLRWKIRSKTFQGIADAMADQWSRHVVQDKQVTSLNP
jgi:site-specific DNA-cytosine methylase